MIVFRLKILVIYLFKRLGLNASLIFCICLVAKTLTAQLYPFAISSQWNDSFSDWSIYLADTLDNESEAILTVKWPLQNTWTEYVLDGASPYRLQIKTKFGQNIEIWELRSPDAVVSMQTKWPRDTRDWVIKWDKYKLRWKPQYPNDMNYWFFEDDKLGVFEIFTVYENDPRDWEIIDQTTDIVPIEVKMACAFITIYFSTPKQ